MEINFVEDHFYELVEGIARELRRKEDLCAFGYACGLDAADVTKSLTNFDPQNIFPWNGFNILKLILKRQKEKTKFEICLMFKKAFDQMQKHYTFLRLFHEIEHKWDKECFCEKMHNYPRISNDALRNFVEDYWNKLPARIIRDGISSSNDVSTLGFQCGLDLIEIERALYDHPRNILGAGYSIMDQILEKQKNKTKLQIFMMIKAAFIEMEKPGLFRQIIHKAEMDWGSVCHCDTLWKNHCWGKR